MGYTIVFDYQSVYLFPHSNNGGGFCLLKAWREAAFKKVWRDMVWVRLCVKLLGDSSFQGLFARQAIGGF